MFGMDNQNSPLAVYKQNYIFLTIRYAYNRGGQKLSNNITRVCRVKFRKNIQKVHKLSVKSENEY